MKHVSTTGFFLGVYALSVCLARMPVIKRIGARMKKNFFLLSVDNQVVFTIDENFLEK